MAIPKVGRRRQVAVLSLHLAIIGALNMVTAQVPTPPQRQVLTTTTTVPTTVIAIAIIALFILVLFCVLVNQWRRRSSAADATTGRRLRRRRGLDPSALAALPVVPYAEVRKHKSGGGVLECAVCLAAFGDGDEVRFLPQCSHAFHPDCIDPWLESHVTCPLCRANLLDKPVPHPVSLSSSPEAAVAVRVEDAEEDDEAAELEKLRCAARMLRSRSTGHSVSMTTDVSSSETGDHDERFTVRLPLHVREEVLRARRLRHATSLVIRLGGASWSWNCAGSSTCSGGERCHGARRRWAALMTSAQGGGEEYVVGA